MSDRWLTSREAMERLNYTNLKSWNRAIHQFGIPHRYIGGRLAFEAARLDAWVMTHKPTKRGRPRKVAA